MKKLFICCSIVVAACCFIFAVPSKKAVYFRELQTEHGTLNLIEERQIDFTVEEWNTIFRASEYEISDGGPGFGIRVCIRIAERPDCSGGVGFRCGFIKCAGATAYENVEGRKEDRTYNAEWTYDGRDLVSLTFNEQVDWDWLANTESVRK
jgi:hypothetical protein